MTLKNGKMIEGYSAYVITPDGKVFSHIKKKWLSPFSGANGYRQITLKGDDGKLKMFYMHRLVATAFISNPEKKPFINHRNGLRHDNVVGNLEWCTHAENIQHANRTGLRKKRNGTSWKTSKLSYPQVRAIWALLLCGEKTQGQIAKEFGVSGPTICEINTGKRYASDSLKIRAELGL